MLALSLPAPTPLTLQPGKVVGLEGPAGLGLTRVGLSLLAPPSEVGTVVVIDARGWFSPLAAWECGVRMNRSGGGPLSRSAPLGSGHRRRSGGGGGGLCRSSYVG